MGRKQWWLKAQVWSVMLGLSGIAGNTFAQEATPASEEEAVPPSSPEGETSPTTDQEVEPPEEAGADTIEDSSTLAAETPQQTNTPDEDSEESDPMNNAPVVSSTPAAVATKPNKVSNFGMTFSDDLEIRYWKSDERVEGFPNRAVFNYIEQVNRFTANLNVDDWTVFAQVDEVALMFNRYQLGEEVITERALLQPSVNSNFPGSSYANVEKLSVKWQHKGLSVTLGDFYAAFGRGGALNVNRNVDIDIDTSIQGLKLELKKDLYDVTYVMGQLNRQQIFQDNPNIAIGADKRHAVFGLRGQYYGLGNVALGAHYTLYDYVEDPGLDVGVQELGTRPDVMVAGLTTEMFGLLGMDWFVEGNTFLFPTNVAWGGTCPQTGYGIYLSSTAYVGATTWTMEGKRYKEAERMNALTAAELYEVAIMPSLEYERQITEDSAAALNSNDIWGGRLKVDWAVSDSVVPYVSVGGFRDDDLGVLHFNDVPETIVHTMAGVEWIGHHQSLLLNSGIRIDDRDGSDAGGDRQVHGDMALKTPLFLGINSTWNVAAEHYHWGVNPIQQQDYFEMEASLTLQRGPNFAVTWFNDLTTNPLVNSTGNLSERLYGAVEIQWKPASAWTTKLFYGAYKAGIRCAGGQCRQLPGFDGARATVTGNF